MNNAKAEQARFDARLTRSQKEFFKVAARLSGFKSLSEFVIHATQQVADSIVEKHNAILASEKDKEIFFDTLVHPPKPNKSLKEAAEHYQKHVQAK